MELKSFFFNLVYVFLFSSKTRIYINKTYLHRVELKTLFQVCLTITEKNVVAVVVVVVVEEEEINNRNVVMVVVVVVVLGEENNRILWPENLYKCATFYLFLSLHFAPEELT